MGFHTNKIPINQISSFPICENSEPLKLEHFHFLLFYTKKMENSNLKMPCHFKTKQQIYHDQISVQYSQLYCQLLFPAIALNLENYLRKKIVLQSQKAGNLGERMLGHLSERYLIQNGNILQLHKSFHNILLRRWFNPRKFVTLA